MEILYVIQDVRTKEYYWRYRIEEGFNADIREATTFKSEEEADKELLEEHLADLFSERWIEVKKYRRMPQY